MSSSYEEFVRGLATEGMTLRAIRRIAEDEEVDLPHEDEPLVRIMIDILYQEETNVEVLGAS